MFPQVSERKTIVLTTLAPVFRFTVPCSTDAGPASHRVRLWQGGACVHFDFVFWVFLNYGCAPGPFGIEGIRPDGG